MSEEAREVILVVNTLFFTGMGAFIVGMIWLATHYGKKDAEGAGRK